MPYVYIVIKLIFMRHIFAKIIDIKQAANKSQQQQQQQQTENGQIDKQIDKSQRKRLTNRQIDR